MDEKKKKTLQTLYRTACNNYLEAFAEKHGFDMGYCDWVGDEPGGVASVGDYFVDMQAIRDDIDMDAPEEEFLKWYDYTLDCHDFNLQQCNFRSWVRGCPRHDVESLDRLRRLREEVNEAQRVLTLAIEEEKLKMHHQ